MPHFSPRHPDWNSNMTYTLKTLFITAASAAAMASPALAQMHGHDGHMMEKTAHDRSSHMVEAVAIVAAILPDEQRISLTHNAIPEVSWPAATMKFPVSENVTVSDFKPGERVQFTLHRAENGALPLVEICKTNSSAVQPGLCAGSSNHGAMNSHQMGAAHGGHEMMSQDTMAKGQMDHSNMDHANMDHSSMDHSNMDHGQMMHGDMDHSKMGHGAMDHSSEKTADATSSDVSTTGTLLKIDKQARRLRIKHAAIAEIGWPVMTMEFEVAQHVSLDGLNVGATIAFDFDPNGDDGYVISAIRRSQTEMTPSASSHQGHGDH